MASLDDAEWARTAEVIDRLATLGTSARMPLSRNLGSGPFVLRFTLGLAPQRITYRFRADGRIELLTAFRKRRDNELPEIQRARFIAEDSARTER
jgi:hypothetical protein